MAWFRSWNELGIATSLIAILAIGCDRHEPLARSIDGAVTAGTRALITAQAPDGAWRSQTYGALKDGLALTPTVLKAVVYAPDIAGSEPARRRGAAYLARNVGGNAFPIYSAAEAAIVLTRVDVA